MPGKQILQLSPSAHVLDCLAEAIAWKDWQKTSGIQLEWDVANLAMVTVLNRIGPTQVDFWPWLTQRPVCTKLGQALWLIWKEVTPRETSYTKLGWHLYHLEAEQWLNARLGCLLPCEDVKYSSTLWQCSLPAYLWLLLCGSSPRAGLYTEPARDFLDSLHRTLGITVTAEQPAAIPAGIQHRRRLV